MVRSLLRSSVFENVVKMDRLTCVVQHVQSRQNHGSRDATCSCTAKVSICLVILETWKTYMTPKLIPLASIILSRRGILKDQINNQGNIAKKKSQRLDQTKNK